MRTELPKKWCILGGEELAKSDYVKINSKGLAGNVAFKYYTLNDYYDIIPNGFTEITFEEFKHLVLKQELPKEDYKYLTTFLRKLNIT